MKVGWGEGLWHEKLCAPVLRLCSLQNGQRGRMDRGNSLPSMLEQKVRAMATGP